MKRGEILQRLEEIESALGDSPTDHYPVPDTITIGQLRRLCRDMRELGPENVLAYRSKCGF